jgi:fermentation-respiration switch protein FrsA (DUF1100 family)
MSIEEKLSKPVTMYNSAGRAVIVTHSYTGHGVDDPSGYYYHYEDMPNSRHWISNGAISIRFTHTKPVAVTFEESQVLKSQATGTRRENTIRAAMAGVNKIASDLGAVSIVTTEKGFCVVFTNDDRLYFDTVEL